MYNCIFTCPKCGSKKTISSAKDKNKKEFEQDLPDTQMCYYDGCMTVMTRGLIYRVLERVVLNGDHR